MIRKTEIPDRNGPLQIRRNKSALGPPPVNPLVYIGDDVDKAQRHQDLHQLLFIKETQESPLHQKTHGRRQGASDQDAKKKAVGGLGHIGPGVSSGHEQGSMGKIHDTHESQDKRKTRGDEKQYKPVADPRQEGDDQSIHFYLTTLILSFASFPSPTISALVTMLFSTL